MYRLVGGSVMDFGFDSSVLGVVVLMGANWVVDYCPGVVRSKFSGPNEWGNNSSI